MGGWIAIIIVIIFLLREKFTPKTPADNWENRELIHKDRMSGMSEKEILQNVNQGRYKPQPLTQPYPVPHRDPQSNKIIIENCSLYYEDIRNHGGYLAQQWMNQGKYNLNNEELEIANLQSKRNNASSLTSKSELEKIDKILADKKIDWRNTEAACMWKMAFDTEHQH